MPDIAPPTISRRAPRDQPTYGAVWRRAAWWVNPAVSMLLIVVPGVLIPFFVPSTTFWLMWDTPRLLDGGFLVVAVACLVGLALGLVPALLHPAGSEPAVFSRQALLYLSSKGPLLFAITLFGYAAWFGIGLAKGADIAGALLSITRGELTSFEAIKQPLAPVGGVTTFMQVGVVATSVYVVRLKLGVPRSTWPLLTLILLALLRTFLYAERLALLEVLTATALTHACIRRTRLPVPPDRPRKASFSDVLVRALPVFAPLGLVTFFGLTEATRSWAAYYANTGMSFIDFVLSRIGGYYATAVNNSALLGQSFEQTYVPLYSIAWFWNMPGVAQLAPYATVTGTDPTQSWLALLTQEANPEYNNVGMLSLVWDYGPFVAPFVFAVFGLVMATLYRRARSGNTIALVAFASLSIALLELPRYFYIGEGRATPVILACLLLSSGLRRDARRKRSTVDDSPTGASTAQAGARPRTPSQVSELARILRRRWRTVVGTVAVVVACAWVTTSQATPEYSSEATLFVSTAPGKGPEWVYQEGLVAQDRAVTYADLVQGAELSARVVTRLGLDLDEADLAKRIDGDFQPETVLLRISVSHEDPATAQLLTQTAAEELTRLIAEVESAADDGRPLVRATIVDPATRPDAPTSPSGRILAVAALLGLVVGVGVAAVRELLDSRITSKDDLEPVTSSPLLGQVSFHRDAVNGPPVTLDGSWHPHREAFRVIRTNLQFAEVDKTNSVVVVTSALPREGKTSAAVNLAIAVAESGRSVLLVDCNLRRGPATAGASLDSGSGLTTVLSGQDTFESVVQEHVLVANLDVLASGPAPPYAADLLQSNAMRSLLSQARRRYDRVIIDAPALCGVADAALLTAQSDGAIVVVRSGKTTREQLRRGLEQFESVGGRTLGVVLNMVPDRMREPGQPWSVYGTRTVQTVTNADGQYVKG